jgi:NADH dehydrogenase
VIVGAGFGGLAAARALRRERVRVSVVDRHNYHTFMPLLYQVATAGLEPQDITHPVRAVLRRTPNAVFRLAEVVGGRLEARVLETAAGERIPYDFLVLAPGSRTETWTLAGAAEHAFGLHSIDDARAYRNHVLRMLERADWTRDAAERERLLTFVVVGGGPTGLETAGALAELRRHLIHRDYPGIDPEDVRVVLVEAGERILAGMPDRLPEKALRSAEALGIEVRCGTQVERVLPDRVDLAGGGSIATRSVLWAAGVRGASLGERLGLAEGAGSRVPVTPTLQVRRHPEVYAIGDLARVEGAESLPQMAPVAQQQGRLAARNIRNALAGRPAEPFRYRDRGRLATIGRSRAVADLFGLKLSGGLAWWAWLVLHLMVLVGFRNRAVVLVNWAYSYFTYDRGARAIVGSAEGPKPPEA